MPEGLPPHPQSHLPVLVREVYELRILELADQELRHRELRFLQYRRPVARDRVTPACDLRVGPVVLAARQQQRLPRLRLPTLSHVLPYSPAPVPDREPRWVEPARQQRVRRG